MVLTAQDVHSQVFRLEFRGYNQEEVDEFLERVTASLDELAAERDRLQQQLRELEDSGGEASETERLLRRTLIAAERTAEQTVNDARAEADQLLEEARREAQETLEHARDEAERTLSETRAEASTQRRDAAEIAQHIRHVTEELEQFQADYRERVQAVIAEQLAVLDRIGDLPEVSPALQGIAREAETAEQLARSEQPS